MSIYVSAVQFGHNISLHTTCVHAQFNAIHSFDVTHTHILSSFLQVDTRLTMPTGLCHSLLLAVLDDSDDEDGIQSPEAPPYSPISDTAENLLDGETQDSNDDDEEPHMEDDEAESNVSNLLLYVYCLLYLYTVYYTYTQMSFLLLSQSLHVQVSASESVQRKDVSNESMWFGYKFVGDNIDKNVKPSLQRHELRGQSLHYFHGYAVRDRVDLSGLSDERPPSCTPDPGVFVPTPSDLSSLRHELGILVSQ